MKCVCPVKRWFTTVELFAKRFTFDLYSCHRLSSPKAPFKQSRRRAGGWAAGGQRAIWGRKCWSEFLVKAAGQWGRQKLIREAASFTTPQLDQFCASVCERRMCARTTNPLATTVCLLSIHVRAWVYLPARDISYSSPVCLTRSSKSTLLLAFLENRFFW